MDDNYKNFLLRLPEDLVAKVDAEATAERRSRPKQLEMILRERYGETAQAPPTKIEAHARRRRPALA